MNYYNEIDPYCVRWLKNLIADGLIPDGDVDDRSIEEVTPSDLEGYTQCHFFAGIAGWSLALRLAGWPEDRPVWTGSCPCQPFSSAGKREGATDERHLWPAFYKLIAERDPATIVGEQVASKLGREWFSAVRLDLEELGYACGAADLSAASVGAPHIRQRLFWVANSDDANRRWKKGRNYLAESQEEGDSPSDSTRSGQVDSGLAVSSGGSARQEEGEHQDGAEREGQRDVPGRAGMPVSGMGNAERESGQGGKQEEREEEQRKPGRTNPWDGTQLVLCADGRIRPIKPGILPVVNGFPKRVDQIRAYGNAIVPQVAAVFIRSFMEVDNEEVGDTLYG